MSSVPSYSAPPRRADATGAPATFSSFGRPPRPEGVGIGFGNRSTSGFDEAAAAAFGKKPTRTFDEPLPSAEPPKVKPAKNTLASVIEGLLPPEPEPKERDWSRSALQQQRKAVAAEKAAQPPPKKSFEEEFPTLGGAGGPSSAGRIPKPVIGTSASGETKPVGSFASLAASWAKSEEERKAAEAVAARLRLEQQQREEFERSQRNHLYFNRNLNRQYSGYDEYEEDDYVEGELGEDEYTEKDRRAEYRAAANHYSDEEEEDEDRADYNIGSNTSW